MKTFLCALLVTVLISSISSTAQFGPGGVGNSSNNGLWLNAENITSTTGSALSTWADASGNNNNATQATAANQPTFSETSTLNNKPVVILDGSNDKLLVGDAPILDNSIGSTFLSVIRPINLNNSTARAIYGKRLNSSAGSSNYSYTSFFWSGGNTLRTDIVTNNNRFTSGAGLFSNNNNYIISTHFDGSLPTTQRVKIFNGTTLINTGSESSSSLPNSPQDLVIGTLDDSDNRFLGMQMAELIQYNVALNSAQLIIVQNYLSAKYNIPIASEDVYANDDNSNGDFDNEVAGIGRVDATNFHTDAKGSGIVRINGASNLDDNEFLMWGHNNQPAYANNITDVPTGVQSRFERVWRTSERNVSGSAVDVGSVNMTFDLNGLGALTASDLRLLVDTDNDGNFNDETPIPGASDAGGGNYTFSGVSALADGLRFTIGTANNTATPLPVTWLEFNGKTNENNEVDLKWSTSSEIGNEYFTVQRSHNLQQWDNLAEVSANVNGPSVNSYSYLDLYPSEGNNYYRIQQTDFDGSKSTSKIIAIYISSNDQLKAYPNPALELLTLPTIDAEFRIYNTSGIDVSHKVEHKVNTLNIKKLSAGTYIYNTKGGKSIKFVKL